MSAQFDCSDARQRASGLSRSADALTAGRLVVLPTDTVYGLAADAFSPEAVAALLVAKGRGRDMPPAVLVPGPLTLDALAASVQSAVRDLVEAFWPGPLTVVCRAQPSLDWDLGDTHGTVAVRMPLHPVSLELLARTGPLAVSSANLSGSPAATTVERAREQLGDAVSVYLDGGPSPRAALASTIVDGTGTRLRVLRDGALPLQQLREVVPDLLDETGAGPDGTAEQPHGTGEQRAGPAA